VLGLEVDPWTLPVGVPLGAPVLVPLGAPVLVPLGAPVLVPLGAPVLVGLPGFTGTWDEPGVEGTVDGGVTVEQNWVIVSPLALAAAAS
jgi:hypothetical protein